MRRWRVIGPGKWSSDYTILAQGLRNSMAFALTPGGDVLQAENSIDIKDHDRPFDEINLLRPGGHYGWPTAWTPPARRRAGPAPAQ